jgi:hypothetical protein
MNRLTPQLFSRFAARAYRDMKKQIGEADHA